VGQARFFATNAGSVHGVRLHDQRHVVAKGYRREVDLAHLAAVQRVQAHLADGGFPAPRPVLAPAPLAGGVAVVETLLDRGTWADAHDPAVRRAVAAGLVQLVEHARPLVGLPGLVSWRERYERLWRQPHDRRFDFPATARGAEWIDPESLAFLTDYEAARGAPFSDRERRTALSCLVAAMAYSARCEHFDRLTALGTRPPAPPSAPIPENGCLGTLSRHGEQLLPTYDQGWARRRRV
jgi:hypothetical protein